VTIDITAVRFKCQRDGLLLIDIIKHQRSL